MSKATQAGPRAAIVVTCHDDGATLSETVASIRSQRPEVELVVVDDGSSDPSTRSLLSELGSDGLWVIHQRNLGQAGAAMTGLRNTSAPYVMRFDSDDILVPDAVAALTNALDRHPEAAAAWGDIETFGLTDFTIPSAPQIDPWLVTYTNCLPGSGTLFRRTALDDAGGWQLTAGFEDWDLWMALADRRLTGIYVPQVVFRYRRGRGRQLKSWLPDALEHYETLRRRHPRLFAERAATKAMSNAPATLKLAISAVETIPWLPRLSRIQLSELFTRLLWNGGFRSTSKMVAEAVKSRTRRR